MPTYVQKTTNSDVSPFAKFNKAISVGTGADSSVVVSLAADEIVAGGFITPVNVPASQTWEDSGTWTVEIEVDEGNSNIDARVRCVRIDAAGAVLQSGAYTALSNLNSSKTFSPVAPAWTNGEEACDNRLAVEIEFQNSKASVQAVTLGLGTALNEVVTDVTEDSCTLVDVAGTLTSAATLAGVPLSVLTGTLTSAGSVVVLVFQNAAVAGSQAFAGALATVRELRITPAGTLTATGSLLSTPLTLIVGTLTSAGAHVGRVNAVVAGVLASAGTVSQTFMLAFAGTVSSAGNASMALLVALAGVLTTAGALAHALSPLRAVGRVRGVIVDRLGIRRGQVFP